MSHRTRKTGQWGMRALYLHIFIVFCGTVFLGCPVEQGGIVVPAVVGLSQQDAETAIEGAGLSVVVLSAFHETAPEGQVIDQNPAAGAQLPPASEVTIIVSAGMAPPMVPNVVGLSEAEAQAVILAAGFTVGTVSSQYHPSVANDVVISQQPAAGGELPLSGSVDIVLSKGPEPVPVPAVVGQTEAAAQASITNASLLVGDIMQEYSLDIPIGNVISQNPVAGTMVLPATHVSFVVSLGPVHVPNVVGRLLAEAQNAITSAGLIVGTLEHVFHPTMPTGRVISQDPVEGTGVSPLTEVNLVISQGSETIPVPDVTNIPQAVATGILDGAGLMAGNIIEQYSNTVPAGYVISHSPEAGVFVALGSAVDLVVSRGPSPNRIPVSSIQDIQRIGNDPSYPLDGEYYLIQDIDAAETVDWNSEKGFEPVGQFDPHSWANAFTGNFDGNGFMIMDLHINRPLENHVGLFGVLGPNAVVRNLVLLDATVTGGDCVGALAGLNAGIINRCGVEAIVEGKDAVGVFAGQNHYWIIYSQALGLVTGAKATGGFVGENHGEVIDCQAECVVEDKDSIVSGGFVGANTGSIMSSVVVGTATGKRYVGGFVGDNSGSLLQCIADVLVHSDIPPVVTKQVADTGDYVGGFVGQNSGTLSVCAAHGSVQGGNFVGGFAGWLASGSVTQCYSLGDVLGVNKVGGLAGQNDASISECYAQGDTHGEEYVGGLVGLNHGPINQCYSTGLVHGEEHVGGLLGDSTTKVDACFWNLTTSGQAGSAGGLGAVGLTEAQMRNQSIYNNAGWNFQTIWSMPHMSYPHLSAF